MKISQRLFLAMLSGLTLAGLLAGCQSTPYQSSFLPEDLLISDEANRAHLKILAESEVDGDTDLLVYALNTGAAARVAMPRDAFEREIRELRKVRGPLLPAQLRDELDEILLAFPDSQLTARLGDRGSRARGSEVRSSSVGANGLKDLEHGWDVVLAHRQLIVSIARFGDDLAPEVNKFILSSSKKIESLIIDLRGAAGAGPGWRPLARLLYGREFESPLSKNFPLRSPEAYALQANALRLREQELQAANSPVPDELKKNYAVLIEKMKAPEVSPAPPVTLAIPAPLPKSIPVKGFTKPIFVLIDATCSDECEHFVDALESHAGVKRVGEPTAGVVQFGDVGVLVLPSSRIVVNIPTSYSEYADGRVTEKKGILPDLRVPAGKDALVWLNEKGNAGAR